MRWLRKILCFEVLPRSHRVPINQDLRDRVFSALGSAHCAVVDEVMALCHEINRIEEEKVARIETKAGIFFGLVGASTAYVADTILKATADDRAPLLACITIAFLASSSCLLAAIWPRRFLRLSGDDMFRKDVLACEGHDSSEGTSWRALDVPNRDAHEDAFLNELHGQEHARSYKKFMIEQYWDNIEYNSGVGEKKARCLIWGGGLYVLELFLVILSVYVVALSPIIGG